MPSVALAHFSGTVINESFLEIRTGCQSRAGFIRICSQFIIEVVLMQSLLIALLMF